MDVFDLTRRLVEDYKSYTRSFQYDPRLLHAARFLFCRDANAAIYVDGPPHDAPEQIRADDGTTQDLIERGYIVIRFHHADDWHAIFGRHSDVFGTPRT